MPLLDHRVVELSWRLPFQQKIHHGVGKRILRDILAKYVPVALFDRPKMGFGVPLDAWLRGPLRPWCDALIMESDWEGLFGLEARWVATMWRRFEKYGNPSAYRIWPFVALASWHNSVNEHVP